MIPGSLVLVGGHHAVEIGAKAEHHPRRSGDMLTFRLTSLFERFTFSAMELISRSEAKAAGLTRYFTGRPCPKGHVVQRTVASKDCVRCALDRCSRIAKANPEKHRADGLRWRANNPEAAAIMSRKAARKHRAKNPEKHNLLAKIWRVANPERVKEVARKWRQDNIENVRADVAKRTSAWRAKNPERRRATENLRRARKKSADGHYTALDIFNTLVRQNYECAGISCAKSITKHYTIDHILPLSRGGSNWPYNIQLLCRSCNSKKGVRTMDEWIADSTSTHPLELRFVDSR